MDWHGRKREEMQEQQERRPPVYNSEDYVAGLKKFCKLTGLQLYLGEEEEEELQNGSKITIKTSSPLSTNNSTEMGLRQFSNISELLAKLKGDLNLSFPSFIREFIGSSNDGVTLLLEALKAIQLSQSNITGSLNQLGSRANHVMFKRALNDEFEILVCLKICSRSDDGVQRLAEHPSGLFTIAVCVMSNYSKSRVLSLQLLARLCDAQGGHKQVSDSISMLRLRFGEPVRFKFLVGMLNSYNSSAFQISCLRFLNRFIETSKDSREKILIQTELEEAGFDTCPLKKLIASNSVSRSDLLKEELNRWSQNYVDVNGLVKKLLDAERANRKLREEIAVLKEKNRHMETEREELKSDYNRLQSELNDNTVLKFEMNENVKFPSYDVEENTRLRRPSSLVTILNSNVVTEDNRTIITCSSSSSVSPSNSPKIVPDSGLSSNSSTHEETKSLSDDSSSHQKETTEEEDDLSPNTLENPSLQSENIRVNVKKTISKFNREAAIRSRNDVANNRVDRVVVETTPNSFTRTPSPPPRCIGETIKAGDIDSFGVPLQTPHPPSRSRKTKSSSNTNINASLVTDGRKDSKSFKENWDVGKSHHRSSSLSSDESSDEKEESIYDPEHQVKSNDNTLETVSARSFGCFVRPSITNEVVGVRRHKSFFNGSKPRTRHGKPKDVMRRSESFHQGRSYSVERLSDDPFHPNNFQRHLSAATAAAAAAASPPKKSSLSKSKSMEFLKAKLLSRKPSSVKSKNNKSNSASSHSNSNLCQQHPGFWSAIPSYRSSDYVSNLNRENSSRNCSYDWRQDTPFWNKKNSNSQVPPPPPSVPPPPPMDDWLPPSSPAFRNGWMMQGNPNRKFPLPNLFHPSDYRQQPASYAFEESTTDLADRLEITELTDEEPEIPSPDYVGNSSNNIDGSFSSSKSGNSASQQARNILDMPSGLY
uniref:GBD/FH3 domain-containing protein n=1 Tax=Lepeophtheirus salmonis TaxID=72036 RepID=A0A0K2T3M1_LEPSM